MLRALLRRPALLLAGALALAALAPLAPARADDKNLRVAADADAGTLDPQAQNIQTTLTLLSWIYEPLVTRDKALAKAPGLATSWALTDPNTWRFKLREGVTFQDGTPFTAADVAFSIDRAKAKSSQFSAFVAGIKDVHVVDDHTIDLVSTRPDPLLPDELTYILIMSKAWAEKNGAAIPQDLRTQKDSAVALQANGTGPYSVVSREPDSRTVLALNPHYWGKTDGNISRVTWLPISNSATRVSALLTGEVDLVIAVPNQDIPRLERDPNIALAKVPEFRTIFFGFDLKDDKLKYGDAGERNPFKDKRVREAINIGIDRDAIVRTAMRGQASVTAQVLAPGNVGYDPALDKPPAFDPAAAKKLLAEAGYPDGFAFTMDCPNDRYVNDEQVCKALATMLAQIGIKATPNIMPRARYFPKVWDHDTSFFMMGFNSPYFDGMYALETLLMTLNEKAGEGIYNYEGYSNPELDKMIAAARDEIDPAKRTALMKEAYAKVTNDVVYVSLYNQILYYAMRKNVSTPIRPDNWLDIRNVTMN